MHREFTAQMNSFIPERLHTYAAMWRTQVSLLCFIAALFAGPYALAGQTGYNGIKSAATTHKLAKANALKLIDIRRPSEWRQTGVGQSAHKISMHQSGFLQQVLALVEGDRSQPIALICARGNRSAWMKDQLNARGFTNVTNVSEGMLGSQAGPGWLKRNLPTK